MRTEHCIHTLGGQPEEALYHMARQVWSGHDGWYMLGSDRRRNSEILGEPETVDQAHKSQNVPRHGGDDGLPSGYGYSGLSHLLELVQKQSKYKHMQNVSKLRILTSGF